MPREDVGHDSYRELHRDSGAIETSSVCWIQKDREVSRRREMQSGRRTMFAARFTGTYTLLRERS
jgi:hypothetical protein